MRTVAADAPKQDHAERWMHLDVVRPLSSAANAAAIGQAHLAALGQRADDGDDLRRRLVTLVDQLGRSAEPVNACDARRRDRARQHEAVANRRKTVSTRSTTSGRALRSSAISHAAYHARWLTVVSRCSWMNSRGRSSSCSRRSEHRFFPVLERQLGHASNSSDPWFPSRTTWSSSRKRSMARSRIRPFCELLS